MSDIRSALFFAPAPELTRSAACPRVDNVGSGSAPHPLCCDCDDCLNGSGGLVLPGAGAVVLDSSEMPGSVAREIENAKKRRQYAARKRRAA